MQILGLSMEFGIFAAAAASAVIAISPGAAQRSIQGVTVVSGFSWNGEEYRGDEVYDPEAGRSTTRLKLNRKSQPARDRLRPRRHHLPLEN